MSPEWSKLYLRKTEKQSMIARTVFGDQRAAAAIRHGGRSAGK